MKILHRYILQQFLRNLAVALLVFVFLFSIFDFFDRIDNVLEEDPEFWIVVQYFLYKIPLTLSLMLPVAMLVSTMFTLGILSKNSEFVAMRAAGLPVRWLVLPLLICAFLFSFAAILFNETVVPHSARRVREIYSIDIQKRDQKGNLSQSEFWWRSGNNFFSVNVFDSRSNALVGLSKVEVDEDFRVKRRLISHQANWISPILGWGMRDVQEYTFSGSAAPKHLSYEKLPLPIQKQPSDFYDAKTDPHTMSYRKLQSFIATQKRNGLSVKSYLADLYAKISFPFVTFIVTLVAIPFSLISARSGSLAFSFLAGLVTGLSYYAVHSFSIAIGRAELWPPLLAAWMANVLLGVVGVILNWGVESPS